MDIAALLQNKFFTWFLLGFWWFSLVKIFSSSDASSGENKDSPVATLNNTMWTKMTKKNRLFPLNNQQ